MFQPVVIGSGLPGYNLLKKTISTQTATLAREPAIDRNVNHFLAQIGTVSSAADLVADRQLLSVALGAFGLQDDLGNTAFIERILSDGSVEPDALANKMTDKRYLALSKAFGFGEFESTQTRQDGFAEGIVKQYTQQSFETAVGQVDDTMRLALNAERQLVEIANGTGSDTSKWFTIMGTPPLRTVFERALSLPASFGKLDIDQQLQVFREKSDRVFGTSEISDFATPDNLKRVVERFTTMSQVANGGGMSSAEITLSLLGA